MFLKKLKILRNIDIVFLVYYIIALHLLVIKVNFPPVEKKSIIVSCGIFLFVTSVILISIKRINSLFLKHTSGFQAAIETQYLQTIVQLIALISGSLILFSIFGSMYTYQDILYAQGGFGLRAISTSLHKLVPLETRWIYLIGPWIFLLQPKDKKVKAIKWVNALIWIILILLTQTKLNYLFVIFFFASFYTSELIKKFSLYKVLGLILITFFSYLALNFVMIKSGSGEQVVLSNPKIINLNIENNWNHTPPTNKCNSYSPIASTAVFSERKLSFSFQDFLSNIYGRIFGVAQRATGAYYCLRDYGHWRPNFRGHQLARLLEIYKPVNRWVMQNMDPVHGATAVTSAVANFIADAYLNSGYLGIFLASGLSIFGWIFLKLLSEINSSQAFYFLYLRYLFCLILMSQSFISAFIVLFFLFLIYYISYLSKLIIRSSHFNETLS
ncbi:MAG: hypothetical protein PHY93_13940 [Bacteriovorax sp.]|nr:hypothetical protein [Bacteriovorax sp.]